jgi:hypothetical protein
VFHTAQAVPDFETPVGIEPQRASKPPDLVVNAQCIRA